MRHVDISKLEKSPQAYLRQAKKGEMVVVVEKGEPELILLPVGEYLRLKVMLEVERILREAKKVELGVKSRRHRRKKK